MKELGDPGPWGGRGGRGGLGEVGKFGQWDLQDRKLEGLSKLRSKWLASVPREDSGLIGRRGAVRRRLARL